MPDHELSVSLPRSPAAPIARRSWFAWLAGLLLACSALTSCTVRLIAEYDEVLAAKTVELQEKAESLFLALMEAADTPDAADGAYGGYAGVYHDVLVLLNVMEVRAESLDKNEITIEQVGLLRDSFERLQKVHAQKTAAGQEVSRDAVKAVRVPFVQQISSILKLQHALRRGA
jgi:hypothetical protein